MTITLERLKTFEATVPAPGQISIAAARHNAQTWPSPELNAYAKERSDVLHRLVDDWGAPVTSWGNTNKDYPSEVVEVVVPIVAAMIGAVGPGLMSAIASRSKGKNEPSIPGFKITNSRGETLEHTFEDRKGNTDKEMLELLTAFLTRSAADGTPGRPAALPPQSTDGLEPPSLT